MFFLECNFRRNFLASQSRKCRELPATLKTATRYILRYIKLAEPLKLGLKLLILLVGAEGFEPPTLWSQTRCATRLRYAPTSLVYRIGSAIGFSRLTSQNVRKRP
jgi:hypothetical protein